MKLRPTCLANQRGIAFVVSLVTMFVLVILGYGILVSTDASTRSENSLKAQIAAFETADSGIEYAREVLRGCLAGTGSSPCNTPRTASQILATAANGGALADSTSLLGFPSTTAATNGSGNTPIVASNTTQLAPSKFQVFVTNDPADGVTNANDGATGTQGHNRLTLTSFASGPNGIGYAVVQSVVQAPLEGLIGEFPGTLVLPGPNVNFAPFSSNNGRILNTSPNCGATILVTSNASRSAIVDPSTGIPSNRLNDNANYSSCLSSGTDANHGIYDLLQPALSPWEPNQPVNPAPPGNGISYLPDDSLIRIATYMALKSAVSSIATFRSTSDAGFNYGSYTSSPPNPQVVYIDGDLSIGPEADNGMGIILVTGNLDIHGNPSYKGLILAIGDDKTVTFSGGGMGSFIGSMVVANIHPWTTGSPFVSAPNFNGNGGATTWGFGGTGGAGGISFIAMAPPRRLSFMQLR